jgi:hypothetical protein
MSMLKRLWTQIVRFAKALEGIDDPAGDCMFSLGKRVEELERAVEHLEKQPGRDFGHGGTRSPASSPAARAAIGHAAAPPRSVAKNFRRSLWLAM